MSEQAARNLRSRGAEIALVANSKTERERIGDELSNVDVVIASTNAPGLVLEAATVADGLRFARLWDAIKASAAADGKSIAVGAGARN